MIGNTCGLVCGCTKAAVFVVARVPKFYANKGPFPIRVFLNDSVSHEWVAF